MAGFWRRLVHGECDVRTEALKQSTDTARQWHEQRLAEIMSLASERLADKERMISDRDKLLASLREELAQARGKIDLMETVMMPLSSRAGGAYVEALGGREAEKPDFASLDDGVSSWKRYVGDHMDKVDAEPEPEPADAE
jgi:hypothetical protein